MRIEFVSSGSGVLDGCFFLLMDQDANTVVSTPRTRYIHASFCFSAQSKIRSNAEETSRVLEPLPIRNRSMVKSRPSIVNPAIILEIVREPQVILRLSYHFK